MSGFDAGWFRDQIIVGSTPFAERTWGAYNRTGIPLVKGSIYQFDMPLSSLVETVPNTEGILLPVPTTFKWANVKGHADAIGSAWHNVVKMLTTGTTANRTKNSVHCVALENNANNEWGEMLVVGETSISIVGVADQVYSAGWGVRGTPALFHGTYFEHLTTAADAGTAALQAVQNNYKCIAISLAAKTEAASPLHTPVSVFFNGFGLP